MGDSVENPTEVMPVGRAAKPGSDDTLLLPKDAPVDPRSGVTIPDARPVLDFGSNRYIGHFEMIRELARGGMGQVFLARDTKLGRKVAIKLLLYNDPDYVQRFLIEARATATCTHENIVTIFEVGEHEGLPYLVLEYLEGKTLSELLEGKKPSYRQLCEIMVPVVRALERAHDHGIIHRDLKPSNIFITDRGHVKVLDFGVARITTSPDPEPASSMEMRLRPPEDSQLTSNSLIGTFPYMSPEQFGADTVDHLSDLWAIGIMFWKTLINAHPAGFTASEKLRVRLADLETPLPSIGRSDLNMPPALVAIIDKCLAMRKAERCPSATALLADLQAFLAPKSEATGDACPYRGLAAFGEEDAKYFFGRENEIRTALAQLTTWPLLAVIGPSGVGKSSFVHAGLAPALRATGTNWRISNLRPGRLPLHHLASVLEEAAATGEQPPDVLGKLRDSPGVFGTLLREAARRRNQKILVVVDQLEELFTLCDSDAIRRVFLSALLAAADDPSSPVRVVLSMRADFLDRLAVHKQFLDELSRGLFFLTAPDRESLREALVRPAELAGYAFESNAIVEDMLQAATSRGALPLLSFAATRLWDARDRRLQLLTANAYQQMGGVAGAFARHADQIAAAVPAKSQLLLRAIMTRLVTPEGTRAVVEHKELLSLGRDQHEVEQILDQLVRGRLIHLNTDRDQVSTVEIVHETLITEWPTLHRWLDDSQAMRSFVHELGQAARQWDSRGRPADLVWRGATAQDALATARRHVLDLSAVESAFLAAVSAHAARARQRRVLGVAAAFGIAGLVIAGGTFFTVRLSRANGEAQEQRAAWKRAAQEAEAAKSDLQQKLDIISDKERARIAAEAQAKQAQDLVIKADENVKLSRGELEKANHELTRALDSQRRALQAAQAEKQRAEDAAEQARKASEEAKAARAEALAAAAAEKARADALAKESKAIYNKKLERGSGSGTP